MPSGSGMRLLDRLRQTGVEDLGAADLAAGRVNERDALARVVDEEPLADDVRLA
jgi:hypothetical protein